MTLGNEEAVLLLLEKKPNLLLENNENQPALKMIHSSTSEKFMTRNINVRNGSEKSWKDFFGMFDNRLLASNEIISAAKKVRQPARVLFLKVIIDLTLLCLKMLYFTGRCH